MITPVSKYFTNSENSICITVADADPDIWPWINKNCKGMYTTTNGRDRTNFYFSDPKDAASFKITWG